VLNEETGVLSEEDLAFIEANPELQQMARDADRDFREERFYTEAEVNDAFVKGTLNDLIKKREREWRERG
jgi:hypothetical protein